MIQRVIDLQNITERKQYWTSRKILQRPPFRFLHDMFTGIMTVASVHIPGMEDYKDPRLNCEERNEYLNMLIHATSADLKLEIDVLPAKICAGKECEKTRVFLQYFIVAAFGYARRLHIRNGRRQWLRAFWRRDFHHPRGRTLTAPPITYDNTLSATDQLIRFFDIFVGLRRLVGGMMSLYFAPPIEANAEDANEAKAEAKKAPKQSGASTG